MIAQQVMLSTVSLMSKSTTTTIVMIQRLTSYRKNGVKEQKTKLI
jgi:hypothetical protein